MVISRQIAGNLIDNYRGKLNYGLSIVDTNGIVLASTDSARCETFHELGYSLILSKKRKPIKVSSGAKFLGTRAGVCMALRYDGEVVGVFELSGDPDCVFVLVELMQVALETTLIYEVHEEYHPRGGSFRESFIAELLYGASSGETDLDIWAEQLKIDPQIIRLPFLFSIPGGEYQPEIVMQLASALGTQDIPALTREGQLIIFKALDNSFDSLLGTYKDLAKQVFSQVSDLIDPSCKNLQCYVGSFQEKLSAYSHGLQHCSWLRRHLPKHNGIAFLYDYVDEYLFEQIPTHEIYRVFDVISRRFDPKLTESLQRIVGTLEHNNYNLVSSSSELFMHKNTLITALDRIKEYTDTQPMRIASDRKLLRSIARYFEYTNTGIYPHEVK